MKGGKPFIFNSQDCFAGFKERLLSRVLYHFLTERQCRTKMMFSLQVCKNILATFRVSEIFFLTLRRHYAETKAREPVQRRFSPQNPAAMQEAARRMSKSRM